MWPYRRSGRNSRYPEIYREMEEDRTQPQSSATSPPHRNRYSSFSDDENDEIESNDEAFPESDEHVDLLLFTSLQSFADVQHTTTMRPLPCDCTEILSVSSGEMASTNYIVPPSHYPHIVYFPMEVERRSSPGRSNVDDPPDEQAEDEQLSDNTADSASLGTYRSGSSITSEFAALPTQRSLVGLEELQSKDLLIPEPTQSRHRLRSFKKMAAPSILATQVANRIIKYARCIRNTHEKDMCCLNCGLCPIRPVTGACGHTRCTKCIQNENTCPCGNGSPDALYVNILIQDLIKKATCNGQSSRMALVAAKNVTADDNIAGLPTDTTKVPEQPLCGARGSNFGPIRLKRKRWATMTAPYPVYYQRIPMTPRARYNYALELVQMGRHREAAPHLAIAAASAQPDVRPARALLAQVLSILSKNHDPRGLTRQINHLVRHLSSVSWIKPTDMECILCCETFTNPVTTPCGHMFCRTCIERTLDYRKRCPLCLRSLHEFKLTETRNTVFVQAALRSINAVNTPPPLDPDLIPIFVCTVAYPSVPCPLFIFDPRYWLMIRRVLESGSRKFGMVASNRGGQAYTDFGTILEVRDCVQFEDGRSILSTVGLSRFKITERGVRDGCEIARILPIIDVPPSNVMDVWDLKMLASQVLFKALLWLNGLNNKVLTDIEAAFGTLPSRNCEESNEEWWESSDGPSWLWWLVAVLPLRSEIKVLILSTDCLMKRLMAVAHTLEAVDRLDRITTGPSI